MLHRLLLLLLRIVVRVRHPLGVVWHTFRPETIMIASNELSGDVPRGFEEGMMRLPEATTEVGSKDLQERLSLAMPRLYSKYIILLESVKEIKYE